MGRNDLFEVRWGMTPPAGGGRLGPLEGGGRGLPGKSQRQASSSSDSGTLGIRGM